ncbi:MAG: EsaB/YukD family protein [Pirellulaceae bacterium]
MSERGSNEGRKGTRVTFLDQTGAKSVDAVIADSVTVKRILPNIITKMNLPVMGPDGQPMSYSLDHKEGGRRLRDEQTLIEAHVGEGDHLIIYPEIVAGGVTFHG